jgi:hypothetical protein
MADMVLRGLDKEFMRLIRVQCARDGQRVKQWVVGRLLEFLEGYDGDVERATKGGELGGGGIDKAGGRKIPGGRGRGGVVSGKGDRRDFGIPEIKTGLRHAKRLLPPEGPLHNTLDRGMRAVEMEVKQQGSVELEIPKDGSTGIPVVEAGLSTPVSENYQGIHRHDRKTCKVYRCSLCAILGVKDAKRGLK